MCSSTPVVVCQRCVERVFVLDGSAGLRVDVILLLLLVAVTQLAWNRDNVGWGLASQKVLLLLRPVGPYS